MALKRDISALIGGVTPKQVKQAVDELKGRKSALLTWDRVSYAMDGAFAESYLWQVAHGKRRPSRRLLKALGIIKPETRPGVRVRMSMEEAREIVEWNTVPQGVKNRIRYQMWGRK